MFEQQPIGDLRPLKLRGVAMGSLSLTLHLSVLAVFWLLFLLRNGGLQPQTTAPLISIDLPHVTFVKPVSRAAESGGGDQSRSPVSRGVIAPPRAMKIFVAPVTNPQALLKLQVSMPPIDAPAIDATQYGLPSGDTGPFSLGPGGPNGIGQRGDGGFGTGPGRDVFRPGRDVSAPILILKVEPDYTDEARRTKVSGRVMLKIVVDAKGVPGDLTVLQHLGSGLDEKAIEAVKNWRFRPGIKDGRPVAVEAIIEVNFRLL